MRGRSGGIANHVRLGTPEWELLQKELSRMSPGSLELERMNPRSEIQRLCNQRRRSKGAKRDHADDAAVILERAGLGGFEREVRVHDQRLWRFDLARRDIRVAVEIEGMNRWGAHPGGHRSVEGYAADLDKYNEAALAGWMVLRFTTAQMNDGTMVEMVRRAVALRKRKGEA